MELRRAQRNGMRNAPLRRLEVLRFAGRDGLTRYANGLSYIMDYSDIHDLGGGVPRR
jgi:hypothetical protein